MGKNYQLGELFREIGAEYIRTRCSDATVCRAIKDIQKCRTQVLGGLRIECRDCACEHVVFASCSNRNCPICPALKKEEWLIKRAQELIPTKYYHVVFTLPHELNLLCSNHPKLMYNILFRSAWQSLKTMMALPKWCGGQAGMLSVLHTWGQNLSLHPHLHCIVPSGCLDFEGKKWLNTRKSSVLVDVKELSKLYRKTFQKNLLSAWEFEGIEFRGKAEKYTQIEEWRALFECFKKDWVVYSKSPTAGPNQTLNYLSRYTHSVAISEGRIQKMTKKSIHLIYKDYGAEDEKGIPKKKLMKLKKVEFLRRFCQHILPSRFQKIRYFGIWASSNRKTKLRKCQQLLGHKPLLLTMQAIKAMLKQKMGIDPAVCPHCGSENIVTFIVSPNGNLARKPRPDFVNRPPPPLLLKKVG